MLGMAMSELTMGARYTALERSDAVRSDGYLTREPKVSTGFPRRGGRNLARLQTVGYRHQTPASVTDHEPHASGAGRVTR
jgi:hypothetical protein